MAYKYFAAGYLVKDGKVLLAHSKKYNKWVPPGGHLEENETPDAALVREFLEETGINIKVVSAFQNGLTGDSDRKALPLPFNMALMTEDFDVPHVGYFYFVHTENFEHSSSSEHFDIGWFGVNDLENLDTYEQIKKESKYVIENYPLI